MRRGSVLSAVGLGSSDVAGPYTHAHPPHVSGATSIGSPGIARDRAALQNPHEILPRWYREISAHHATRARLRELEATLARFVQFLPKTAARAAAAAAEASEGPSAHRLSGADEQDSDWPEIAASLMTAVELRSQLAAEKAQRVAAEQRAQLALERAETLATALHEARQQARQREAQYQRLLIERDALVAIHQRDVARATQLEALETELVAWKQRSVAMVPSTVLSVYQREPSPPPPGSASTKSSRLSVRDEILATTPSRNRPERPMVDTVIPALDYASSMASAEDSDSDHDHGPLIDRPQPRGPVSESTIEERAMQQASHLASGHHGTSTSADLSDAGDAAAGTVDPSALAQTVARLSRDLHASRSALAAETSSRAAWQAEAERALAMYDEAQSQLETCQSAQQALADDLRLKQTVHDATVTQLEAAHAKTEQVLVSLIKRHGAVCTTYEAALQPMAMETQHWRNASQQYLGVMFRLLWLFQNQRVQLFAQIAPATRVGNAQAMRALGCSLLANHQIAQLAHALRTASGELVSDVPPQTWHDEWRQCANLLVDTPLSHHLQVVIPPQALWNPSGSPDQSHDGPSHEAEERDEADEAFDDGVTTHRGMFDWTAFEPVASSLTNRFSDVALELDANVSDEMIGDGWHIDEVAQRRMTAWLARTADADTEPLIRSALHGSMQAAYFTSNSQLLTTQETGIDVETQTTLSLPTPTLVSRSNPLNTPGATSARAALASLSQARSEAQPSALLLSPVISHSEISNGDTEFYTVDEGSTTTRRSSLPSRGTSVGSDELDLPPVSFPDAFPFPSPATAPVTGTSRQPLMATPALLDPSTPSIEPGRHVITPMLGMAAVHNSESPVLRDNVVAQLAAARKSIHVCEAARRAAAAQHEVAMKELQTAIRSREQELATARAQTEDLGHALRLAESQAAASEKRAAQLQANVAQVQETLSERIDLAAKTQAQMNGLMKEMEHLRHARAADSERHRQELEWAEDQRATMSAQMASLSTDLETVRTEARVARTRHEQLVEELTAAQERDVRVITAERDHAQQQLADHVRRYDELAASLAMTNEHSKLLKAQYESTLAQAEHQQQTLAQRLDDKDAMLVDARERMLADHRAATVLSADLKQKLAQLGADRDNLTTQLKAASQASLPVSAGSATRDVASREPPAVPLSPLPLRSAPVHSMATQSMAVQTDGIPTALPPPFAPSPSLEAQRQEQLIAIQALQRQHEALSHAIRQAETHLERTTRRNEQQRAEHAETALLLDETAQSVRQLEHAADLARDAERGAMDAYRRIRIEHDHLHDAVEHLQTMLESRQQTVDQLTAQVAAIRGDVTTATASLDQVRVEAAAARAATREASDDLAATRVRITQVRADLADAEAALQQVRKATEAEKAATERAAAQDRALAALTTPSPAHPAAPLGDAATSSSASSKSPSLAATSPSVPAPSSAPLPASTLVRSQPDRAHTASHAATMELEQTIKGLQNQLAVAESKAAALQRAHDRAVAAMATSAATASLSMPSPQPKRPRSLVARSAVPARPSSAAGIGLHHHASDDGSATAVPAPSLSARATYVLDNHGDESDSSESPLSMASLVPVPPSPLSTPLVAHGGLVGDAALPSNLPANPVTVSQSMPHSPALLEAGTSVPSVAIVAMDSPLVNPVTPVMATDAPPSTAAGSSPVVLTHTPSPSPMMLETTASPLTPLASTPIISTTPTMALQTALSAAHATAEPMPESMQAVVRFRSQHHALMTDNHILQERVDALDAEVNGWKRNYHKCEAGRRILHDQCESLEVKLQDAEARLRALSEREVSPSTQQAYTELVRWCRSAAGKLTQRLASVEALTVAGTLPPPRSPSPSAGEDAQSASEAKTRLSRALRDVKQLVALYHDARRRAMAVPAQPASSSLLPLSSAPPASAGPDPVYEAKMARMTAWSTYLTEKCARDQQEHQLVAVAHADQVTQLENSLVRTTKMFDGLLQNERFATWKHERMMQLTVRQALDRVQYAETSVRLHQKQVMLLERQVDALRTEKEHFAAVAKVLQTARDAAKRAVACQTDPLSTGPRTLSALSDPTARPKAVAALSPSSRSAMTSDPIVPTPVAGSAFASPPVQSSSSVPSLVVEKVDPQEAIDRRHRIMRRRMTLLERIFEHLYTRVKAATADHATTTVMPSDVALAEGAAILSSSATPSAHQAILADLLDVMALLNAPGQRSVNRRLQQIVWRLHVAPSTPAVAPRGGRPAAPEMIAAYTKLVAKRRFKAAKQLDGTTLPLVARPHPSSAPAPGALPATPEMIAVYTKLVAKRRRQLSKTQRASQPSNPSSSPPATSHSFADPDAEADRKLILLRWKRAERQASRLQRELEAIRQQKDQALRPHHDRAVQFDDITYVDHAADALVGAVTGVQTDPAMLPHSPVDVKPPAAAFTGRTTHDTAVQTPTIELALTTRETQTTPLQLPTARPALATSPHLVPQSALAPPPVVHAPAPVSLPKVSSTPSQDPLSPSQAAEADALRQQLHHWQQRYTALQAHLTRLSTQSATHDAEMTAQHAHLTARVASLTDELRRVQLQHATVRTRLESQLARAEQRLTSQPSQVTPVAVPPLAVRVQPPVAMVSRATQWNAPIPIPPPVLMSAPAPVQSAPTARPRPPMRDSTTMTNAETPVMVPVVAPRPTVMCITQSSQTTAPIMRDRGSQTFLLEPRKLCFTTWTQTDVRYTNPVTLGSAPLTSLSSKAGQPASAPVPTAPKPTSATSIAAPAVSVVGVSSSRVPEAPANSSPRTAHGTSRYDATSQDRTYLNGLDDYDRRATSRHSYDYGYDSDLHRDLRPDSYVPSPMADDTELLEYQAYLHRMQAGFDAAVSSTATHMATHGFHDPYADLPLPNVGGVGVGVPDAGDAFYASFHAHTSYAMYDHSTVPAPAPSAAVAAAVDPDTSAGPIVYELTTTEDAALFLANGRRSTRDSPPSLRESAVKHDADVSSQGAHLLPAMTRASLPSAPDLLPATAAPIATVNTPSVVTELKTTGVPLEPSITVPFTVPPAMPPSPSLPASRLATGTDESRSHHATPLYPAPMSSLQAPILAQASGPLAASPPRPLRGMEAETDMETDPEERQEAMASIRLLSTLSFDHAMPASTASSAPSASSLHDDNASEGILSVAHASTDDSEEEENGLVVGSFEMNADQRGDQDSARDAIDDSEDEDAALEEGSLLSEGSESSRATVMYATLGTDADAILARAQAQLASHLPHTTAAATVGTSLDGLSVEMHALRHPAPHATATRSAPIVELTTARTPQTTSPIAMSSRPASPVSVLYDPRMVADRVERGADVFRPVAVDGLAISHGYADESDDGVDRDGDSVVSDTSSELTWASSIPAHEHPDASHDSSQGFDDEAIGPGFPAEDVAPVLAFFQTHQNSDAFVTNAGGYEEEEEEEEAGDAIHGSLDDVLADDVTYSDENDEDAEDIDDDSLFVASSLASVMDGASGMADGLSPSSELGSFLE